MNAKLRGLPDGAGACRRASDKPIWFETSGTVPLMGEIFWPFALHGFDNQWQITHLPSGYRVLPIELPRRRARACLMALRALPVDWQFTKPSGRKWETVKKVAAPIVKRYRA